MTHNGHGSEPDGAGPPPGGEPWWAAQDPSPSPAAAPAETEDESTQQIRHLGNRPERPRPQGAPPADPQQPWPLPATPGAPGAAGPAGGPPAGTGRPQPSYGGPPHQPPAGPPPGAADDAAATQLIPPVSAAPQQRPGDDADATQLIPPLPGPYEAAGPGYDPQAAGRQPPPHPGAAPAQPPAQPPYTPPSFEDDSPRPARHAAPVHTQFEGLFRDAPGGPGAPGGAGAPGGDPGATQKLPPVLRPGGGPPPAYAAQQPGVRQPAPHGPGAHGPGPHGSAAHPGGPPPGPYGNGPGGPGGRYYDEGDDHRGGIPRWAAIAIGTAACAAVGITAGWLLSSGDGGGDTASGATPSASASEDPGGDGKDDGGGGDKPVKDDPAESQAEDLDALLAESNDSRDAVISSVENIRQCKALGKAAKDLRDAAGQRRDLVDRLADLSVDKLPSHQDLTRSLTDAWNASASADDHYANWADAAKRGRGCGGGGNHLSAGNRASGDATTAKEEAAGLWNPIADEYGLTQRQATQL
ncbi:hypothetical protein O7599_23805 [Streptomyces sp. WMMC500]|uniref:hypothetical protein n=1 Tax=Streptomyces sp. WMMC500 TaxID=3015154 RepID=UPI00248A9DFC|nr:hypothetical protein [Streptomyces sp. WMMC500]WBB58639.1 hypothetical protein O7599_23805 [Streptomyces sp. WMMC500]